MLFALKDNQKELFSSILDGTSGEAKNPEVNQRITIASLNHASHLEASQDLETNDKFLAWFADELKDATAELQENHNKTFFGEGNLIAGLEQFNLCLNKFVTAYSNKDRTAMQILYPSLYIMALTVLANLYPLSHKVSLRQWVTLSKNFRAEITNDREILNTMKHTGFDATANLFSTGEVFPSLDWARPIFSPRAQKELGEHVTLKDLTRHFETPMPLLKKVWIVYVNALPARSFSWVNVEKWQFPEIDDLISGISILTGYVLSEIYMAGYAELVCLRYIQHMFDGTLTKPEVVNLVLARSYKVLTKSVKI